ncbi:DNA excision repair protein ERCC-5 homolog [Drosophila grimshawi]|uniref:DNA excision repair protein ERCC-5 homolog n=1 Tax=Drosophila grimshawi TaxID=7222 RepID=UPI000C86F09B|nr:DNA excision repair protein ERCC-5 homolog [Drosophila grimshawi]
MGVTGLWKLIEPCGKPVPVETLEGKVLAVDISIWLHQVVKGFQDSKGSALNNAHLLGLFHRLCKLLYYRVRPVFIFDGSVPQLKRDTIARRQQQRSKLSNEADRIQALLLQSLAKEKVVQQALGTNAEMLLKSPIKRGAAAKSSKTDEDDLFKLPELPATSSSAQISESDYEDQDQEYASTSATSDSSFDESTARHSYNASLQAIDVRSQHFKNLPADVRHEILTDIKETRKQSSWGRLHELPARSDDFCSFQMKRLLKRRAVQESLEQAEDEMGGRTLTYAELSEFFSEEGIVTPTAIEQNTRQISSDEHVRFLLVRDLKKKSMATEESKIKVKCETIKDEIDEHDENEEKPSTSANAVKPPAFNDKSKKELGVEYDADLQMALALSLEETKVYDEKDYDYDSDQDLRLNREQSKNLRHAAKGPARTYMIEYGGMNEDEVENIMEATQLNDTQSLERLLHNTNVNDTLAKADTANNSAEEAKLLAMAIEQSKKASVADLNKSEQVEVIDSDTDSDLEEVVEVKGMPTECKQSLEICVDIKDQLNEGDDLFADLFENESELKDLKTQAAVTGDAEDPVAKLLIEEIKEQSIDSVIEAKESVDNNNEGNEGILTTETEKQVLDSEDNAPKMKENCTESEEKSKKVLNISKDSENSENIKLIATKEIEKPAPALSSILDELKRQTDEVKNIKLESVKLSNSMVIELSSDDESAKVPAPPESKEVIELCDTEQDTKTTSPNKTPSKSKAITDYFETTYKIKRTPEKPQDTEVTPPTTPKVAKPFYVRRTPKSGGKRSGEKLDEGDVSPSKKPSKAAKSLFENGEKPEEVQPVNTEDLIKDAADALKSQNTSEELEKMATDLAKERRELEAERNRQDRMGMSISQRMSNDCQELLRLFGIPYIVAPMEAEAQCAFLNAVEITNGTITDDSDIWLFGGRTVYKNFFAQNKHVLEFRAEQIEQTFNCNRSKLIQLACLVGSDYTTGIHGIGAVTALEILASFTTSKLDSATTSLDTASNGSAITNQSVLSTLVKFRDWWQSQHNANIPVGSTARISLRKKLKNINLHEGFPSSSVVEAYLTPKVDETRDAFSWGSPDVESIREFARKFFGWTTSKTDDILMPVMKKINEKKIQGSIRNYFTAKSALRVQQPMVSKRVQTAIDKMSGKIDAETPEKPKRATRRARNAAALTTKAQEAPLDEEDGDKNRPARPRRVKRKGAKETEATTSEMPSTSEATSKPAKCARIPNTKEVIPQRERDLEQMRQNKAKAAEVLRTSLRSSK